MIDLSGHLPRGAQVLEGAELDFSRYGDTLFEVLFAVRGFLLMRLTCWSLTTCYRADLGSVICMQSCVYVVNGTSSVVVCCASVSAYKAQLVTKLVATHTRAPRVLED